MSLPFPDLVPLLTHHMLGLVQSPDALPLYPVVCPIPQAVIPLWSVRWAGDQLLFPHGEGATSTPWGWGFPGTTPAWLRGLCVWLGYCGSPACACASGFPVSVVMSLLSQNLMQFFQIISLQMKQDHKNKPLELSYCLPGSASVCCSSTVQLWVRHLLGVYHQTSHTGWVEKGGDIVLPTLANCINEMHFFNDFEILPKTWLRKDLKKGT